MSITVVEGRPGTGKSVFLVDAIIRYLHAGHEVYTNVDIKLPDSSKLHPQLHYIESLDEIVDKRSGKVVLDEVQVYLNSRNWDKLDIRFQLLLQQHRKRGLDILGATQSIKRADVVFRELVHYFYRVRKVFIVKIFKKVYGLFIIQEYDPDTIEGDRSQYQSIGWPKFVFADPFVFRCYDTTQEYSLYDDIGDYEIVKYLVKEKTVKVKTVVDKQRVQNNPNPV